MKKILKFFALVSLCATALVACKQEEFDTDQYGQGVSFSAMAPNPIMRGAELRILGNYLENVVSVNFAGDVSVTDITVEKAGARGEIRVVVPLEGPEPGKVTIVTKDGVTCTSHFDLTFTEPIEIESFSPATVLSGDVLTFKGEYLNDVKEVIFTGIENAVATEFESQSRHELKVKVPYCAISGPVILSDVNEIEDENTIPNHIYTKTDLVVGNPTVVKAAKAVYKSGDVITVSGEHLDMIQTVDLPQAADVAFQVSEDAKSIQFNLSPAAGDGNITLTSFAGVTFDAGEIETVNVKELSVVSLAADQRFKAGSSVQISGSDLDLVTKVEFTGAEADWYMDGDKIVATQPETAKDGAVTVTLESGKKAYSEDIEVVKPEILAWEQFDEYVAGKTVVLVEGLDLDLVVDVVIGNKEQGLVPCEFELVTDNEQDVAVKVALPEQAYTGPIIFTSAAGYTTETEPIEVTYDMAVSITFNKASYGLGERITLSGKNLLKIEQVYIKNKKVTDFGVRADDAMAFEIPEGVGPGFYRLDLVLTDGTELTWPFPLKITAPYTETTIWEGSSEVTWSGGAVTALSWGGYDWSTVTEGMVLAVYYTVDDPEGCIRFGNGSWASLPSLAGLAPDGNLPLEGDGYTFELTDADLNALVNEGGLVICGTGYTITEIALVTTESAGPVEKAIWEGESVVTWGGGAVTDLSWGGYDWSTVEAGTILCAHYTIDDPEGCIRFGNGSWAAIPSTAGLAADGNLPLQEGGHEVELTQADIDELVANGGLVVCGTGYTITQIGLK